jgi:hypothetical protein
MAESAEININESYDEQRKKFIEVLDKLADPFNDTSPQTIFDIYKYGFINTIDDFHLLNRAIYKGFDAKNAYKEDVIHPFLLSTDKLKAMTEKIYNDLQKKYYKIIETDDAEFINYLNKSHSIKHIIKCFYMFGKERYTFPLLYNAWGDIYCNLIYNISIEEANKIYEDYLNTIRNGLKYDTTSWEDAAIFARRESLLCYKFKYDKIPLLISMTASFIEPLLIGYPENNYLEDDTETSNRLLIKYNVMIKEKLYSIVRMLHGDEVRNKEGVIRALDAIIALFRRMFTDERPESNIYTDTEGEAFESDRIKHKEIRNEMFRYIINHYKIINNLVNE